MTRHVITLPTPPRPLMEWLFLQSWVRQVFLFRAFTDCTRFMEAGHVILSIYQDGGSEYNASLERIFAIIPLYGMFPVHKLTVTVI